jgi:hypothetical protein
MIKGDSEVIKFKFTSCKNNINYEFTAKCTYELSEEYEGFIYTFEVYEECKEDDDTFSLILLVMKNGNDLKVVDLNPDSCKYYLGKGISISLILKCREIFGKRIVSSSNLKKSAYCEWNSSLAIEKVWKPLVKLGFAIYVKEEDQYIVF